MDGLTVPPALLQPAAPVRANTSDPAKIRDAAQQFEALLLTELLKSAHPSGGWLGSGDEDAAGTAFSFAEQQLATTMAKQGGIGLSGLIAKGLEKENGQG
jgi:Rod binding domain-containing protein